MSYERKYFISKDQLVRITVDEKINYSKPNKKPFILNKKIKISNLAIIEIKYNNNYNLEETFADFFRTLSRNSKYTNGIDLIYY